jgi:hypothetical protein
MRSISTGHPAAQFAVGVCYSQGRGVAQNEAEAVRWYSLTSTNLHAYILSLGMVAVSLALVEADILYTYLLIVFFYFICCFSNVTSIHCMLLSQTLTKVSRVRTQRPSFGTG